MKSLNGVSHGVIVNIIYMFFGWERSSGMIHDPSVRVGTRV